MKITFQVVHVGYHLRALQMKWKINGGDQTTFHPMIHKLVRQPKRKKDNNLKPL